MFKKRGVAHSHLDTGLPIGIRLLTIYTALLGIIYLFLGTTINVTFFFGKVLTGEKALILNLVFLLVIAIVIHGLVKPNRIAWNLALFWFLFEIANSLVSMVTAESNIFSLVSGLMTIAFLFVMFIDGIIIWYLMTKRKYFYAGLYHTEKKVEDRIFSSLFLIILLFGTVLAIFYVVNIYSDTLKISKGIVSEFHEKSVEEAVFICQGKFNLEHDVCYVTIAAVYDNAPKNLCSNINYNFYRFTCLQALT